jgi:Predicted periplasmic or secreted lipoprotein
MKSITKLLSLVLLFGAPALSAVCTDQNLTYSNTGHTACPSGNCPLQQKASDAAEKPGFFQRMGDQNETPSNNQQIMRSGFDGGGKPASYNQNQKAEPGFFSRLTGSDDKALQNPELLRRVHQVLMNNRNIDARAIQITTDQGGTVTLIGVVRNDADKANAENAIKNISGVKSVDNKLTIQPTASTEIN